jgi:hypothetical protein
MPKSPSIPLLLEQNSSLPLCRVQVTLRAGGACDASPAAACGLGKGETLDGLANFATELQRRGAGGKSRAELDETIDALGASVQVLCWHDQVLFEAMALKENIDKACAIPTFRRPRRRSCGASFWPTSTICATTTPA